MSEFGKEEGKEATANGQPPISLEEISQIALTVSDVARSTSFYRDKLGMKFLFEVGNMAFFACGAIRFALGTSAKPVSPGGTILYFRVADIQAAHRALEARGVTFIQKPHLVAKMRDHDLWLAFLADPDENPVGLMCEVAGENS